MALDYTVLFLGHSIAFTYVTYIKTQCSKVLYSKSWINPFAMSVA